MMQQENRDYSLSSLEDLQALVKDTFDQAPDEAFAPVPEETLKGFYLYAYTFYQQGHYDQSEHFFRLLTMLNAFNPDYWIGLGAARQAQKEYATAIEAYCAACVLDEKNQNPEPILQMANCYFALNQVKEGLKALDAAEHSAKQIDNTQLLDHLAFLRSIWSNTMKNHKKIIN